MAAGEGESLLGYQFLSCLSHILTNQVARSGTGEANDCGDGAQQPSPAELVSKGLSSPTQVCQEMTQCSNI